MYTKDVYVYKYKFLDMYIAFYLDTIVYRDS